jgi:pyruvate/2-oxoacid:ferredoxin oxidoreductase beta subunit
MSKFLTRPNFPYCKGCGHHLIARNTARALEKLQVDPLDVVLVTDVGCHGIVDSAFATHTVHGLHGRSVALGTGIALGLAPGKKVIVFIGDGGSTIGLQHIVEAARLNVPMTVVVHNNMLYGMTGGQPSGLTPCGLRTLITPAGNTLPPYDLCRLTHTVGAAFTRRVLAQGDFSAALQEALETDGFALVEMLELCPSYADKLNPDLRLKKLAQQAGYEPQTWSTEGRAAFQLQRQENTPSLLDVEKIEVNSSSALKERVNILLSGSAGEGVQRASLGLARAAMACGLHVTKRSSYPVTVGVGFSAAEIILSRTPIIYYNTPRPDVIIVTSTDGLQHSLGRIQAMEKGTVWLDASLETPQTQAAVRVMDFRGPGGARGAMQYALEIFAQETGIVQR